jgi:hypothetical protein
MLSFVKDLARAGDTQDAHWTASRLKLLSVLSSRALTAAKSELDNPAWLDEFVPLIRHTSQIIEDVVDFSVQRGIINCNNEDASFPWLHVLPAFAPFFSTRFYDQLRAGFHAGTFTSNGDLAAQQLLLQSVIAPAPSGSVGGYIAPPLPEGRDITSSLHPLLRRGTPLRLDLSAPQPSLTFVRLQEGVSVPLTEAELSAAAQDPPTKEVHLSWRSAILLGDLRMAPSSRAPGVFLSVRDVLDAIHAAMARQIESSDALKLELYSPGSEPAAAASRRSQRSVAHGLPDTDPLRWIDFAPGGTFFGGCDHNSQSGLQLHFIADPAPGLSAASTVAEVAEVAGSPGVTSHEDEHKSSRPPSSDVIMKETSHPSDGQVDVDADTTVDGEKAEVVDIG